MRRSLGGRGQVRLAVYARVVVWFAFFHIHLHHFFHHRFHGPPFDYVGLALGAVVSSAGFPGPGEALLIAGGILAAAGRLDLSSVIAVAFVGGTVGGILGWLIGLKAGRTVLTAPGPLYRARLRALKRGDRIFHRRLAIAVIVAPSWVAGIHHVRSRVYQPLNALAALIWALAVGIGAYLIGPSVADFFGDLGLATLVVIGGIVIGVIVFELVRRRRGPRRTATRGPGAQGAEGGDGGIRAERGAERPEGGVPSDQAGSPTPR